MICLLFIIILDSHYVKFILYIQKSFKASKLSSRILLIYLKCEITSGDYLWNLQVTHLVHQVLGEKERRRNMFIICLINDGWCYGEKFKVKYENFMAFMQIELISFSIRFKKFKLFTDSVKHTKQFSSILGNNVRWCKRNIYFWP